MFRRPFPGFAAKEKTMSVRVRFAPSPTGNVHIGNIRVAIFNWLFARHNDGTFLLRIEDTDRERSTPEAIANLFSVMEWLGLDYDERPLYQSTQQQHHLEAAERLIAAGHAYRAAKGGGGEAVLFRIPVSDDLPCVSNAGMTEIQVHAEVPVEIDGSGIRYATVSRKGKPVPQNGCLAGFRDLSILDSEGNVVYEIEDELDAVIDGRSSACVENAVALKFRRRHVILQDHVKGKLTKPLDSLRDQVIVRSDGTPVFHLANICDDLTQKVTHIVRGDDHVENTYRHILLYHALGETPPRYAHLPMIVNQQGKPYSKRDGDAFVGDFRQKGYLPEALFNYLSLLGWSPGDDREKLSRRELTELFSLDRVQRTAAQMDVRKLDNLNSLYMSELPFDEFLSSARKVAREYEWGRQADEDYFRQVAALMQSRTKNFAQVGDWEYFFLTDISYDAKACRKFLRKDGIDAALQLVLDKLQGAEFTPGSVETAIHETTEACGIRQGKLNQPLRVAVTGTTVGPGIYETMAVLGSERVRRRIQHAIDTFCGPAENGAAS